MSSRRFIVYADFLGTTRRYSTPKRVVRGRELLEQALAQIVLPRLTSEDMNLYVFSDTAIITCPKLTPLLEPIAKLFKHFLEMPNEHEDPSLTLWLRAAVSTGKAMHVDHLQNNRRVRTIPFLDTSLPTAYDLEGIRKGSRVFVDPHIQDAEFDEHATMFQRWKQITGHGGYAHNVAEYLWPAMVYESETDLANRTRMLHASWKRALSTRKWSKDKYFDHMLHLDETVKLFLRTSSRLCAGDCRRHLLVEVLPDTNSPRRNVVYEWGVWFQAMRGLVENCKDEPSLAVDVQKTFPVMKAVLERAGYLQHFLKELDYPDYAAFRAGLCSLDLHRLP